MIAAIVLAAAAAKAPPTLLVVPFAVTGDPDAAWVGEAAAELLLQRAWTGNEVSWMSLRQLNAVLKRRDQTFAEASSGMELFKLTTDMGATHAIAGKVTAGGPTLKLSATLIDAIQSKVLATAEAEAPKEKLAAALVQLGDPLFKALGVKRPAPPPPTADPMALRRAIECHDFLLAQPLGPRSKPVLPADDLDEARMLCETALQQDKRLGLAQAGLALVHIGQGDAKKGLQQARASHGKSFLPLAALVEYYALVQLGDLKGAAAALEKAVKAHPGFLHARGYLGEHYNVAKEYAKGLKVFEEYRARCPGNPWVLAQVGYSKARLGNIDASIEATALAYSVDLDNAEVAIELASRLIDAGKLEDAAAALGGALATEVPRPLAHLRLGYIRLLQGRLDEAIPPLLRAVQDAKQPDEFRTRGIAHYDLGRVYARQGKKDAALAQLQASRKEGHPPEIGCGEPDLKSLAGDPRFAALCKAN